MPPPPIPPSKEITRKILDSWNVYVKERKTKRLLRANTKPLRKRYAEGLGAYITDHSTARTFMIKPTKGKPGTNAFGNYFSKNRRKFRKPVKKGRIIYTSLLTIEKSKHLIDTRGEKRQLSAARIIAKIRRRR